MLLKMIKDSISIWVILKLVKRKKLKLIILIQLDDVKM